MAEQRWSVACRGFCVKRGPQPKRSSNVLSMGRRARAISSILIAIPTSFSELVECGLCGFSAHCAALPCLVTEGRRFAVTSQAQLRLAELALVPVRLDHVADRIVELESQRDVSGCKHSQHLV